jgi:hypothetical protein
MNNSGKYPKNLVPTYLIKTPCGIDLAVSNAVTAMKTCGK